MSVLAYSLNVMNKLNVILLVLLFYFFKSSAAAQVGCIGNSIPLQPSGAMYTSYNSQGYYEVYGTKYTNPTLTFCVQETGNSCNLKGLGSYVGTEVTFGPLPCPLDAYVFPLVFGRAFLAIRSIKNK